MEILIRLRKNAGLTQKDICKIINVSRSTYNGYELDKFEPNIETLKKLADFYNISVDYLIGHRQNNKIDKSGLTNTQKNIIDIVSQLNETQANRVESYAIAKLEEQQDMQMKYENKKIN